MCAHVPWSLAGASPWHVSGPEPAATPTNRRKGCWLCRLALWLLWLGLGLPARAQFTYTTNDGSILITGCVGQPSGFVTIPAEINGLSVTAVGD